MVNSGFVIAGILGAIVGVLLISAVGALGTMLGAMFLCGGVGVLVMGIVR